MYLRAIIYNLFFLSQFLYQIYNQSHPSPNVMVINYILITMVINYILITMVINYILITMVIN